MLKAVKNKYNARLQILDAVVKKLNSLLGKIEATKKALSRCSVFVVVFGMLATRL